MNTVHEHDDEGDLIFLNMSDEVAPYHIAVRGGWKQQSTLEILAKTYRRADLE